MSGGALFYLYRTYTATVSGSQKRREQCAGCSWIFEYTITREAAGGGHSGFMLNNAGAAESAKVRARANLNRELDEAIEPVHCPACGIYQPAMVRVLRERHGKRFEPNKYASERITAPPVTAWRAACAANTVVAYNKFIEVWPTFDWLAKKQIKQLRYPPYMRKLVSNFLWIAWGVLVLFVVGIFVIGMSR
jgi:hypothetical protein